MYNVIGLALTESSLHFRHPVAMFFHLVFRSLALLTYLLCSWFGGFIASFVVIVLLLALDFWTVKNITGDFENYCLSTC